ncbi:MAG: RNA polymerase sigma factor [Pseudomonadota bacterium]
MGGGRRKPPEIERHYVREWRSLVSRSRRIVGCPFVAEEIAQEAFLRWMVKRRRCPEADEPELGLLYRILRGLSIDTNRAKAVRRRLAHRVPVDAAHDDPEQVVLAQDVATRAEAALLALPERTRAAFLMRRDQEMSFAEIGAALGVSAARAHQLAGNALSALMVAIDDENEPTDR